MLKNFYVRVLVVGAGFLLCSAPVVFADLTNGDFSTPGLYGWTVESGNVSDGGGYALFQEHPVDMLSSLVQEFTLPALALELSFDVAMSSVPGGDHESWPDAFMALLLDPLTFGPLISNPGYTEFYYLDNTGYLETVATVSGNNVSLDVSSLAGLDVFLAFDLLGGDDGMLTSVELDNVNVSVVPAPGALLLGLIGIGTVGTLRRSRMCVVKE